MACNTLRITLYTYTLNDKISLSMILYAVYASSYNKYVHPKRDICDVYIYIKIWIDIGLGILISSIQYIPYPQLVKCRTCLL